MSFSSLARELDTFLKREEKTTYVIVNSVEELQNLVTKLKQSKEIAFTTVATNHRPLSAKPVGIGFSICETVAYYIPLNGSLNKADILSTLKPIFQDPNHFFFGHNSKYDLHLLASVGIEVKNLAFDTILASYLLYSANRKHSLDHLSLHYFGKVKTSLKELTGTGKKEISMEQVPLQQVFDYCCQEIDYTFRIKKLLDKELNSRKLESLLVDLELPLTHVLMKMEQRGVYLDTTILSQLTQEVALAQTSAEKEIYALAGEEFNINSPKQLSLILFEKLEIKPLKKIATGHSTRAEVLENLAGEHPIADKILEYRSLEKLRSTYLEVLPQEINLNTGRIHPTFNQFIAATGRLACQDPNLQNIPVRTLQGRKVREAFRPQKEGWSYLSADYSQVELRLLAHLSGDPQLIKAFQKGEDIHTFTASLVFGIPLEEVSKMQRNQAKAINFGIIYGQQAYGLSQELKIDVKEAQHFIEAYFIRYPRVSEFVKECVDTARTTGKSVTMIGRERELPEIHSSNAMVRAAAERLAINTPLQGSAADLIKLAMLEIDRVLTERKMETKMVLQIHDELIFEAPDHELDVLQPLVKQGMEGVFSLKVPLVVDLNIGKNWAEC